MKAQIKSWLKDNHPEAISYFRVCNSGLKAVPCFLKRRRWKRASQFLLVLKDIFANILSTFGLAKRRRECPNCEWRGFVFLPAYYVDCFRANVSCPRCGAIDRYRSLAGCAKVIKDLSKLPPRGARALEIAPMPFTPTLIRKLFGAERLVTFDLSNPLAMVRGDLQTLPFASRSFDLVICFEVLDYIPNDAKALQEIFRVLSDQGCCLLRVGYDREGATIELNAPDPDDSYHIRRYGADLPQRLGKPGFKTTILNAKDILDPDSYNLWGAENGPFFLLTK